MIDKYKKGLLSEEEMEKVEADLLKQLFRQKKEASLRADLKQLAIDIANEESPKKKEADSDNLKVVHQPKPSSWLWLRVAASVAFLAIIGWWFMAKPQPISTPEALADTYLTKETAPIWSTIMDNTTLAEKVAKAKEAYQKGDFSTAVTLFEAIPPTDKEHYFYLGIAALRQPKPDATKAIDNLLKARALANGWQEDATNWYLALAYLRNGQKAAARQELTNIINVGRDNVTRAEEILKKL